MLFVSPRMDWTLKKGGWGDGRLVGKSTGEHHEFLRNRQGWSHMAALCPVSTGRLTQIFFFFWFTLFNSVTR